MSGFNTTLNGKLITNKVIKVRFKEEVIEMENIKFIKKITDYIERDRTIIGNCVYYNLSNGNKIKMWCYESGVKVDVINKIDGKVDTVSFPFANYFKPTQCSVGAPQWTQHIENGRWYFSNMYDHVLPKTYDYINLAKALDVYIEMYE